MSLSTVKQDDFPEEEVRAALTDALLQVAKAKCLTDGKSLPTERIAAVSFGISIDSLAAVDTICEIEDIVKSTMKAKDVVKPGGYTCVAEALDDMVPKVRRIWEAKAAA